MLVHGELCAFFVPSCPPDELMHEMDTIRYDVSAEISESAVVCGDKPLETTLLAGSSSRKKLVVFLGVVEYFSVLWSR
jgi:hypothetical protein